MGLQEHVFAYRDCCLSVHESRPFKAGSRLVPVFLHGRFGDALLWAMSSAFQQIRPHYRCLLLDLPGYGRSFMSDPDEALALSWLEIRDMLVELLAARLEPGEQAVLVGHDLGAVVAQFTSLVAPPVIGGLVLTGSRSLFDESGFALRFLRYRRWQLLRASPGLSRAHRRGILDAPIPLSLIRGLERSWPGRYERLALRKQARKLSAPVLLLWGKQDRLTPPEHGFHLANAFGDARYLEHEEGGHWSFLDQDAWFATKLSEFLFHLDLVSSVRWGKSS